MHPLVLEKLKQTNNIEVAFGGLNLNYENQEKADLVIVLIKKDSVGAWQLVNEEYTNFEKGIVRIRGQEAKLTEFGIYIKDRYSHISDTLITSLTPILEVEIPRGSWKNFVLPNDAQIRSGRSFNNIKDGSVASSYLSTDVIMPHALTIDLNVAANISRIHLFSNRSNGGVYGTNHIYDFAIYGSNSPNPSGDWDSTWTLLQRFQSVRPSGLGFGVESSDAEKDYLIENGETYEITDPLAYEKFRYIRLRVFATWNGDYEGKTGFYLNELYLFGQY